MSPEHARNQGMDGRSDLFSLGVCLYETFLGQRLFPGTLETPVDEVYGRPLPNLCALRPDLPTALQVVLEKVLSMSPDARFTDARSLRDALAEIARQQGWAGYAPGALAAELRAIMGPDVKAWMPTRRKTIALINKKNKEPKGSTAPTRLDRPRDQGAARSGQNNPQNRGDGHVAGHRGLGDRPRGAVGDANETRDGSRNVSGPVSGNAAPSGASNSSARASSRGRAPLYQTLVCQTWICKTQILTTGRTFRSTT